MQVQEVKPFSSEGSKKAQIEEMFDDISRRYDFLNHFLSLGIDRSWRKTMIRTISKVPHDKILDVATGTADVAIAASKKGAGEVIGVDISENMLAIGRKKIEKLKITNVRLDRGDSESLQFPDNTFDVVTVAFGVRNYEDLRKGLAEMRRVLKPGGMLAVLEFSYPTAFPVKQFYGFYNAYILPFLGKIFSGSRKAYTYLPESVKAFPEGKEFVELLSSTGLTHTQQKKLTFGICSLYTALKDEASS
ncbi:MAG: bifunctional demethylmenaquinone methyltransferase/2-methoxy-6-polyprenyl-1,4-benzoquinol methylase UbiE [Flavobacteriales bacterium]|nr:bifunctional demethylmenaquinone methyltransferase/2-methoxy-6-polyprenyl-1,4-benzoquinol methylase UbiE [Flavobacteriales bacterium]